MASDFRLVFLLIAILWTQNSEAVEYKCPAVSPENCPVNCQEFPYRRECEHMCTGDETCDGNQLCCYNPCGKFQCSNPEVVSMAIQGGACPAAAVVGDSCFGNCLVDSHCGVSEKCCRTTCSNGARICTSSLQNQNTQNNVFGTEERPGTCPSTRVTHSQCNSNCAYDGQCQGQQKCCRVMGVGCSMEVCMGPVVDVPGVIGRSCPVPDLVKRSWHECNDRTTCKDGLMCCSDKYNHGKCVEPPAMQQFGNIAPLVKEGVCKDTAEFRCSGLSSCAESDGACPGQQKCCKDVTGASCCQPGPANDAITQAGEPHSNSLVAREYLMSFDFKCMTAVDRKITLTPGRPITKFQIMMLPMQNLMGNPAITYFPNLHLQLWSPQSPGPNGHPRYSLVCEKVIERPTSLPQQLLYEFDVTSNECFRNPNQDDKIGFRFDLFRYHDPVKNTDLEKTVIPVPYDYDSDFDDPASGRTDLFLDSGCESPPQVGDPYPTEFPDSNGFPGKWSFGCRQSGVSGGIP